MKKNLFYFSIIFILVGIIGYLLTNKKEQLSENPSSSLTANISIETSPTPTQSNNNENYKTYTFNQFHSEEISGGIFQFNYPTNWYNNGQYFSPQPIKYYDLVSVDAPMYFDLVAKELWDTSDIKYQITNNKKNKPDSTGKIDGKTFKKYDLIDYGSSGGESSGRVIIYVGPQISFNGSDYYLVFRWEEHPLTLDIPGNDPQIFENIVSTLKFN